MFTKQISKSLTGALRPWLIVSLITIAFLLALPRLISPVQSAGDGFNQVQSFLEADMGPSGLDVNYDPLSMDVPLSEEPEDSMIYLPLVLKNFPFTPDAPLLYAISSDDGDGNYTVSWSSSEGADTYTLQEDDNAAFSTSTTVYSGPNTSTAISGKDVGTYYYRVRGSNAYAGSGWSNTRSVVVTVPLPDCPRTGPWFGTTSQGYPISFVVENSPRCQIEKDSLSIKHSDYCGIRTVKFLFSITITNNSFVVGYTNNGVKGSFPSSSTAVGTFDFYYPHPYYPGEWCSSSGTWTAPTNAADSTVSVLAVQADGKIVVGASSPGWVGE